ncbi:MAG: hypothetical protein OXP12_06015, partial [Thaumarchaeota archaeon]|nr:hypothetical protein [Nitrososphaerota archaeon]
YGLSEATCTSTMNPPGARRIGSVGTVLAGPQVRLRGGGGRGGGAPTAGRRAPGPKRHRGGGAGDR